jgi:hypothetical protein
MNRERLRASFAQLETAALSASFPLVDTAPLRGNQEESPDEYCRR